MVLSVGDSHLDVLFQKSLRYNHHKENYQISLRDGIIPSGLRIKKEPAFVPVTEDFHSEWNSVLFEAEKLELQFPGTAEQKKFEIANKHQAFKNNLFTRRKKKWSKFNECEKKENIKNKTSNEQSKKSSQQINKTGGLSN